MNIEELPVWKQRQDSVSEQLADLKLVANRLGFYDAADVISQWCDNFPEVKYGCHCDLEDEQEPDGCVIDSNRFCDCVYANQI